MLSVNNHFSASLAKLFSKTHEWIDISGNIGTVGISSHAAHILGDVNFVDVNKGTQVSASGELGNVEASKATSPIMAPMAGTILEVNAKALDDPIIVSKEPEGAGWICKLTLDDPNSTQHLLNADDYKKYLSDS